MSQERFIRCKHCGLPHEARVTLCPMTGNPIDPPKRRKSMPPVAVPRWGKDVPAATADDIIDDSSPSVARFMNKLIDGKYRVDELIGRGGMGAVYRAEHVKLQKPVAIKVLLRGHMSGSEAEQRFLREARVAGNLGHPNIVPVFDFGTLDDDGAPFLVMELLEGETLHDRLEMAGAIPMDEVVTIASQVLSALTAAHDKGIVHRDLKPDNVFLTERNGVITAKLLDFGISKNFIDENTMSLTRTGAVVGTPYYLAPEQARGDRKLDHRVDIWACGVLMYESLTGTLPFRADNYNALLIKILNNRPSPPSKVRPTLPPALEAVVMTALAFDADERFSSAEEMLEALTGASRNIEPPPATQTIDVSVVLSDFDDMTVADMRHSQLFGPGPEDATEISDSFSHADIMLPKIDESS